MRVWLIGGDRRTEILGDLLRKEGYAAENCLSLPAPPYPDACILPVPASRDKRTVTGSRVSLAEIAALPSGVAVLGGGLPSLLSARRHSFDYLTDPSTVEENARLTAEATVGILLSAPPRSLWERRVHLFGYGRIGRHLVRLLTALGVSLTVAARREETRAAARLAGADAVDFCSVPAETFTAVNTAPSPVMLPELPEGTVLYDLAGISSAEIPAGIDYRPLPGLPGKYYPESAARLLFLATQRNLERSSPTL